MLFRKNNLNKFILFNSIIFKIHKTIWKFNRIYKYISNVLIHLCRYLSNYEALVEQLFKLHTYAAIPSVLLIDDLDDYFDNLETAGNDSSIHIAKICTLILHSMKSCSRILKKDVSLKLYILIL